MTSRVRNRKPRTSRMDAAIDAMMPLGFTSAIVRKKVNHLLSVYGGDESWKFIEEDAYKVLIDSFLDDQEEAKSVTCMEEKKVEQSNEEGEIVTCSLEEEETLGLVTSYYDNDCDDDDEFDHFEPATKASDIEFPKTGEGNSSSIYVGGIRRPFLLNNNIEGSPAQGSNITDVSCSNQGRKRPLCNRNGSERVSSPAFNSSNNNQGERKLPFHGNNSKPKRKLVRLASHPNASHK